MKKIVSLALSAIMLLSITACGNNAELEQLRKENEELKQQLTTQPPSTKAPGEALKAEDVCSVKELKWTKHYSNAVNYHDDLIITNTYNTALQYNVDMLFYDADGNVIGTDDYTTHPVLNGQSTYVNLYLDDAEFSSVEYTITPKRSSSTPIDISKLTYELSNGGNDTKYVLSMTNNDTVDYYNTAAYIVFYNGDEIVEVEYQNVANSDYTLAAGATEYEDFSFDDLYTDYEIYPIGRIK